MGGQPQSGISLRRDLMDLVEELSFPELNLIADIMFPAIHVSSPASQYPVLPRSVIMKIPDTSRAPGGTYSRGQWEWGAGVYTTTEFGHEEPVDLVSKIIHKDFIDEEEVSARLAVQGLLLGREARVASAVLDTAVFSLDKDHYDITNEWDGSATCTPWADINNAYLKCRSKCLLPKIMFELALSDDNVEFVIRSKEVKESVQYTDPVVTYSVDKKRSFLANYFGVKAVRAVTAMYDSNGFGESATRTAVAAKFWSNEHALLYLPSTGAQTFKERCIGRQISFDPYAVNYTIDDYFEPQKKLKIIRACEYRGMIINLDYGCLINNMKGTVDAKTKI